jgi:hypothetical protein
MTRQQFLEKWISYAGKDALHGTQEFGRDVDALVEAERERCAKIAESYAVMDRNDEDGDEGRVPFEIVKAIRESSARLDEKPKGR